MPVLLLGRFRIEPISVAWVFGSVLHVFEQMSCRHLLVGHHRHDALPNGNLDKEVWAQLVTPAQESGPTNFANAKTSWCSLMASHGQRICWGERFSDVGSSTIPS